MKTHVAEDGTIVVEGTAGSSYQPSLPFTEYQQRRKAELELTYAWGKEFPLEIDSIEPTGGPTTGDTRVLVRGGPFEEMDLIYPNPMCKFGANDRVVKATYVKCSKRPISMVELEGRNKMKVSCLATLTVLTLECHCIFTACYYDQPGHSPE